MAPKRNYDSLSKDDPVTKSNIKTKGGSDDEEDFDMVNVDFEWFNFDSTIDFHGTKTLLRQLLDVDATLHNISALADLIISQNTIGSTVKTDSKANDPYAICTALNITHHHAGSPTVQKLVAYLQGKAEGALAGALSEVLTKDSGATVALVVCERLINIPIQVIPPLYTMLAEEIQDAVDDEEPYKFTHYLFLSRVYTEVESMLVEEPKIKKAKETMETFYFHAEDEVLQKHAVAYGSYDYTNEDNVVADSKRAFQEAGIKTRGHLILLEARKYTPAVKAIEAYVNGSAYKKV